MPWRVKPIRVVDGVVRQGMFVALALSLQLLESMLPMPLPIPGLKLGLANLVSVYLLLAAGWQTALRVAAIRVLLELYLAARCWGRHFGFRLPALLPVWRE